MSEREIAVSVIIPVYNASKTIAQTLDSLLSQSLRNIEIICVDDGSTDDSVQIIRQIMEKDGRVSLLQQQNQFAGAARNRGVEAARGEWLFFLDSDDYVMNYGMEAAYDKCVRYDLDCLKFRSLTWDETRKCYAAYTGNDYSELKNQDFDRVLPLETKSPLLRISVAPWSGFYRRSYVQAHGMRFNSLRCVNDRSFYTRVITNGGRFMITRDWVTVHRVGQEESLVGQKAKHFNCHIESLVITERQLREDGVEESLAERIMRREYTDLIHWYRKYAADPEQRQNMIRMIEEYEETGDTAYSAMLKNMWIKADPQPDTAAVPVSHPVHSASDHPTVSVITVVRDAEACLNAALDSLSNQTLEDLEFLVVNDGSEDHSLTILKEYAERDKRFRLLDLPRAGYGRAANQALEEARGEYVSFLEPEGFVARNFCELLSQTAKQQNLDVIRASAILFARREDGTLRRSRQPLTEREDLPGTAFSPADRLEAFALPKDPFCGLVKRSLLKSAGIRFCETPAVSFPDWGFGFRVMAAAKKAELLPDTLMSVPVSRVYSAARARELEAAWPDMYSQTRAWLYGRCGMNPRLEKALWDVQLRDLQDLWSRLDGQSREPALNRMRQVLEEPYRNGLLEASLRDLPERDGLMRMLTDPAGHGKTVDLSVILPVYNQEEHLETCLRTLLASCFGRVEVICVDDGSTDRSAEILRSMEKEDSRIRVLSQCRRGAGVARNEGLLAAKGEWTVFLEADDEFEPGLLDAILKEARIQRPEILIFPVNIYQEAQGSDRGFVGFAQDKLPETMPFSAKDIPADLFRACSDCVWNKLFRTEYLRKTELRFDPLMGTNDLALVLSAAAGAEKISVMSGASLVHHRRVPDENQTPGIQAWDSVYEALLSLRENLRRMNLWEERQQDFANYALSRILRQLNLASGPAWLKMYEAFSETWAQKLGLADKGKGCFRDSKEYGTMKTMLSMDGVSYALSEMRRYRDQSGRARAQAQVQESQLLIENSLSYRIGRKITWLPRKIRGALWIAKHAGVRQMLSHGKTLVGGKIRRILGKS